MLRLAKFLKPFTAAVIFILVLMFAQTLSQLYLPTLMSDIVDVGIVNADTRYIFRVGALMLVVAAIGALATIAASYLSARVATGFSKNLRSLIFSKVESFSLAAFDTVGTASLITRTTNDITQLERVLIMLLRMMLMAPMMAIGGIIMALSKDATLSLIIVFVVPLLGAAVYFVAGKAAPLFRAMQAKLDRVNLVLRENLTGIRVIRAFNRVDFEERRFDRANLDLTETAITVHKLMAAMMPAMMLLLNFTTIAVVWFGGIRIDRGFMQVGELMAFIQYIMHILFSFIMFSMMFIMIPRASASADRVNEVLDITPKLGDPSEPRDADDRRGHLEFRNVTFSYSSAERPALKDLSFRAQPGEVTAVIGGTGSGKSTLAKLILRFYDVDSGTILVDGVDVREQTQHALRSKIGYVPQTAALFTGTVAANIRYGNEAAADNEVCQAAKTAQATEFISSMDGGFNATVTQGGSNLSGGQKQRLSIARALVRRPEIYVFDDSLSALDFKTEAQLRAGLREVTMNSTVLIITQRVSAVMDAERIIVLDDGLVRGIGTHEQLLETCDVYREIAASQLSEKELA